MRFRWTWFTSDFFPAGDGAVDFGYSRSGMTVRVEFREVSADEIARGRAPRSGVIEAECRARASRSLVADFRSLAAGRLPEGSRHRAKEFDVYRRYVDSDGVLKVTYRDDNTAAVWNPPSSMLPPAMATFITDISGALSDYVRRTVRTLEWATGRRRLSKISSGGGTWSFDGRAWYTTPGEVGIGWAEGFQLSFSPSDPLRDYVQDLVQSGADVPVAHVLLGEATEIAASNARAALLMVAAAAEVGLKEFISAVVPDAGWLAYNVPAPPVPRVLRRYLPALLEKTGTPELMPSADTLRHIEDGFELRNRVSHAGADGLEVRTTLRDFLPATNRLLRALDAARGLRWARTYISDADVVVSL